jgi:hypothetical protein
VVVCPFFGGELPFPRVNRAVSHCRTSGSGSLPTTAASFFQWSLGTGDLLPTAAVRLSPPVALLPLGRFMHKCVHLPKIEKDPSGSRPMAGQLARGQQIPNCALAESGVDSYLEDGCISFFWIMAGSHSAFSLIVPINSAANIMATIYTVRRTRYTILKSHSRGCCMGTVVGYLRHYTQWNGKPGLSLDEQKSLVRDIARETGYDRARWCYVEEGTDGKVCKWPVLRRAVRRAEEDIDIDHLLVIPTLEGVRYNLSFLSVLEHTGGPVKVCSGWRKPSGKGTKYVRCKNSSIWLLSYSWGASEFREMVQRVRERKRVLPGAIRAGLQKAVARGVKLGGQRRGASGFSRADQSRGGAVAGAGRRIAADEPYQKWIPHICRWRANGLSLGQIAMKLADRGARTPAGRPMGRMLIYRILKRRSL